MRGLLNGKPTEGYRCERFDISMATEPSWRVVEQGKARTCGEKKEGCVIFLIRLTENVRDMKSRGTWPNGLWHGQNLGVWIWRLCQESSPKSANVFMLPTPTRSFMQERQHELPVPMVETIDRMIRNGLNGWSCCWSEQYQLCRRGGVYPEEERK